MFSSPPKKARMQLEIAKLDAPATNSGIGLFTKHDVVVLRKAVEQLGGPTGLCAMNLNLYLANIMVDPVLERSPEAAIQ
jgi:hypothetical protein